MPQIKHVSIYGSIDIQMKTILTTEPKSVYQLLRFIYDYNSVKNYVLANMDNLPLVDLIREALIQYLDYLSKNPNSRSHPNYPSEKIGTELCRDINLLFGKYLDSLETFLKLPSDDVLPSIYRNKYCKGKCSICQRTGILLHCDDGDFSCRSCINKHGIKMFNMLPIPKKYEILHKLVKKKNYDKAKNTPYNGRNNMF